MSNRHDPSPEQIEREIAETRVALSDTLDAIQARFSPMRLLSGTFGAARGAAAGAARGARNAGDELKEAGGDFAGNLGRTIRDNPVPVALFGIGLGWLMLAGRRNGDYDYRSVGYEAGPGRWEEDPHPPPFGYAAPREENPDFDNGEAVEGDEAGTVERMSEEARQRAGSAYKVVEGRAERVKDTMAEIGAEVRARAAGTGDSAAQAAARAKERLGAAAGTARNYAGRTGTTARDYAGRARQRATYAGRTAVRVAEEHPLMVAAGLLAAGATLAALLPRTRREDAWMGEGADAMRESARGVADEVKGAAGSVIDAARDAAEREGLTPADIQREAVRTAEKAGNVAHAAADTARSETDKAVSRTGGNGGATDAADGGDSRPDLRH